jgi:hypothetical protein
MVRFYNLSGMPLGYLAWPEEGLLLIAAQSLRNRASPAER